MSLCQTVDSNENSIVTSWLLFDRSACFSDMKIAIDKSYHYQDIRGIQRRNRGGGYATILHDITILDRICYEEVFNIRRFSATIVIATSLTLIFTS